MLLYREKIICRDIYTKIIDKFDVISWLSTESTKAIYIVYTKTGIYLLS